MQGTVAAAWTAMVCLLLVLTPATAAAGPSPAPGSPLRLVGLRGATTATANSREGMTRAVSELMAQLIQRNQLQPDRVVSATFSATADLDALFPAAVARRLPGWDGVALLDLQQLAVRGDLARCIRVLLLVWLPSDQMPQHVYLGQAARLRPDRAAGAQGAAPLRIQAQSP